jgi:hypothetical protein
MIIRGIFVFGKKFILEFKHKIQIGVSSFSGGSGFGTAEVGDGLRRSSVSAIWDSFSSGFSSTSSGVLSKTLVRMLLPELAETRKNDPPEAVSRYFEVSLSRPI